MGDAQLKAVHPDGRAITRRFDKLAAFRTLLAATSPQTPKSIEQKSTINL
jgi:hypothetical protein